MTERIRKQSVRSMRLFNLSMYKKDDSNDLHSKFRSTLKNSPRMEELKDFMEKEFSSENAEFLTEVKMFKTLNSTKNVKEWFISKIYNTYINVDSEKQINILSKVREDIEDKMESGSVSNIIFDHAVKDIEHLIMNDTFTRFLSYKKEK